MIPQTVRKTIRLIERDRKAALTSFTLTLEQCDRRLRAAQLACEHDKTEQTHYLSNGSLTPVESCLACGKVIFRQEVA